MQFRNRRQQPSNVSLGLGALAAILVVGGAVAAYITYSRKRQSQALVDGEDASSETASSFKEPDWDSSAAASSTGAPGASKVEPTPQTSL